MFWHNSLTTVRVKEVEFVFIHQSDFEKILLIFFNILQRATTSIVGAIILITAGTITAANGDLDFDMKSYSFGICSVLSQVNLHIFVYKRFDYPAQYF